jgi:hypothetical protein
MRPTPEPEVPAAARHAGVMATYGTIVGGAALVLRARRQPLPPTVPPVDVALLGLATHKVARLLTKDTVTRPLRAPFTEVDEAAGNAELHEHPVGGTARRTVGELLTCPFCMGQWVATGFTFSYLLAPRFTRLAATLFSSVAISDFLQLLYARAAPD